MNKILILFTFLTFSISTNGQNLDENEIVGNWNVKRIIQKPSIPEMAPVLDGFENGTFMFDKSGDFDFKTSSNSEMFSEVVGMIQNTKWKFESSEQLIKIGSEEDKFSIMGIYVKKVNGMLQFHLDESGLRFEMTEAE